MKRSRTRVLLGAAAAVTLGGLVGPTVPEASADCLYAEAYSYQSGSSTRNYVVGPKTCVVSTPWPVVQSHRVEHQQSGLPPGTPNGGGVAIWLPSPVF